MCCCVQDRLSLTESSYKQQQQQQTRLDTDFTSVVVDLRGCLLAKYISKYIYSIQPNLCSSKPVTYTIMTSHSSGLRDDPDVSRVELPVFLNPTELLFTPTKRRCSLTVFNPYQDEVQFRILTTSPERYDVGVTKGTIKAGRRIDIIIRLLSSAIPDLPDASETSQSIDYFRISVQFGQLKGARPLEVHWSLNAPQSDPDTSTQINDAATEVSSRFRGKSTSSKSTPMPSEPTRQKQSQVAAAPTRSSISRPSSIRPARQPNHLDGSSNVNLGESSNNHTIFVRATTMTNPASHRQFAPYVPLSV